MAIVDTVYLPDFIKRFKEMDRDYYSEDGYAAMYNYYCGASEDTNDIEMDVIAFCGEWSEFDCAEDACADYNLHEIIGGFADDETEESKLDKTVSALETLTTVYRLPNGRLLVMAY